MRILGIDTTTKFLALGVYDRSRIAEYNIDLGRRHTALLVPVIERCLASLGLQAPDIDYFAVGIGPGSFTGIRVGLSTMKGFAFALKKPLVGIPTLDILAQGAMGEGCEIAVFVDAKRGLLYAGRFREESGFLKRVSGYKLIPPEAAKTVASGSSVILGDGAGLYRSQIRRIIPQARILGEEYWYPKGRHIVESALERIRAGKLDEAGSLQPVYLYPKECQIRK